MRVILLTLLLSGCSWLTNQQQYISQVEMNYDGDTGRLAKIQIWCESGEKSDQKTVENPGF